VKLRPEVDAVLQHVGRRTWDLVLIDATGLWVRDEFESEEAAHAVGIGDFAWVLKLAGGAPPP
jgi:hypothetical protein